MYQLSAHLPDRWLGFGLIRRGLMFWILGRVTMLVLGIALTGILPATPVAHLRPAAALGLIAGVAGLGVLETRRVHEHRFLANLGVSQPIIVLMLTLPAVAAELLVAALA